MRGHLDVLLLSNLSFSQQEARLAAHYAQALDRKQPVVYIPGRHQESFRLELIPPPGIGPMLFPHEYIKIWRAACDYDPAKWIIDVIEARLQSYPPYELKPDATRLAPASEFR